MSMKLRYMIFPFIYCLIVVNCLYAAPSITAVSGTVSNGQAITITGASFGSTGPNILLFDDFELGSNGTNMSDRVRNAQVGTWRDVSANITPYYPTYSNLQAHSGSLALRQNWGSGSGQQEGARWASPTSTSVFTKIYFSFWTYLPAGQNVPGAGGPYGPNWKVWWLSTNDYFQNDYASEIVTNPPSETSIAYVDGTTNRAYYGYASFRFTKGIWLRWEGYLTASASAGSVYLWHTDSGQARNLFGSSTGRTIDNGTTGWQYIHFPGFGRYDNNSNTYYDDIYIATGEGALARVEIGNQPTYSTCTNLAVCTVNSWNSTSINATVRNGSFSSGTAYLYVIDSTGVANINGYPITIGSTTTPPQDTTPPARPATPTITILP